MRRAAVYSRISKDDQGAGLGVERQRRDCLAYCKRHGWEVVEFTDNDLSASRYARKQRAGFEAMLDAVRSGSVDAVVIAELSRFTREPRIVEDLIDLADNGTVELHSPNSTYDPRTSEGRMRLRMESAMHAHYSDFLSEKHRRKKDELAERGVPAGGSRPFGFEPGGVTIRKKEADAIRRAVRRFLDKRATLTGIARDWNDKGLLPPQRGKAWAASTVRKLFLNARLAGLRVHRGEIVGKGAWPPILDRETWERLRQRLNDSQVRAPSKTYLLTGFAHCGNENCGTRLNRTTGSAAPVIRCRKEPGRYGCGTVVASAERVEEVVVERLLVVLSDIAASDWIETLPEPNGAAAQEIERLEERKRELARMWAAGEIDAEERLVARQEIEKRLQAARRRFAPGGSTVDLHALLPRGDVEWSEWWASLLLDVQRSVLAAFVDRVIVKPSTRRGRGFDRSRVKIHWRV